MTLAPVLLIEDNLDDVDLTRLAFAEAGIDHPLVVAPDGAFALDWLRTHGNDAGTLPAVCTDAPANGFSLLIIPAFSALHSQFAREAPQYEDMYL